MYETSYEINVKGNAKVKPINTHSLMTLAKETEKIGEDGHYTINLKSQKTCLILVPMKWFLDNLSINATGNLIIDGGDCDKVTVRNFSVSAAKIEKMGGVFFENYKEN